MYTLAIIMPHYKEPWSIVKPFFDVLNSQRGIDFSKIVVRIVHDGEDIERFPDEYFANVPYAVYQDSILHSGVSAARNAGMDNTYAKWITFCDCDDTFTSIYALRFIFDVLDTDDYDLLWNGFVMESMGKDGIMLTVNEKFNLVWTHNKYYRLDFLRKHNLRFNERLYMSEDSAFNAIVNLVIDNKRIGHIKSPVSLYVWCYRGDSVTLKPENKLRNMIGHFDRNVYVAKEFRERDYMDADLMVGRTLTDAYVNLTRTDLPDGWETFRDMVRQFAKDNQDALNRLKDIDIRRVLKASETEASGGHFLNENRPKFSEWLKDLQEGR